MKTWKKVLAFSAIGFIGANVALSGAGDGKQRQMTDEEYGAQYKKAQHQVSSLEQMKAMPPADVCNYSPFGDYGIEAIRAVKYNPNSEVAKIVYEHERRKAIIGCMQ
jgi:hypothetical protein